MCTALQVSRSGYYAWRERPLSARVQARKRLLDQIRERHEQTREAYGAVKLWRELNETGVRCGKHTVAGLRLLAGLSTRRQRRFRAAYASRNATPPAPRLLQWPFVANRIDEIWVGDMTQIVTRRGVVHLAVLLDLYSRHVVGWSMADKATTDVPLGALEMAIGRRQPAPGLIHHSDQGIQYASSRYRDRLEACGLVASMSRKGNCLDNAVAESFFSTLKNEMVYGQDFMTRGQAKTAIFDYIEVFYNRQRRHQSLGYISPSDFEAAQLSA